MGPGFSAIYCLNLFFISSALRDFSWYSGFPLSPKLSIWFGLIYSICNIIRRGLGYNIGLSIRYLVIVIIIITGNFCTTQDPSGVFPAIDLVIFCPSIFLFYIIIQFFILRWFLECNLGSDTGKLCFCWHWDDIFILHCQWLIIIATRHAMEHSTVLLSLRTGLMRSARRRSLNAPQPVPNFGRKGHLWGDENQTRLELELTHAKDNWLKISCSLSMALCVQWHYEHRSGEFGDVLKDRVNIISNFVWLHWTLSIKWWN